jgi:hypothetical protein
MLQRGRARRSVKLKLAFSAMKVAKKDSAHRGMVFNRIGCELGRRISIKT